MDNTISFKLLDRVGLIAITPTGWHKELNIVQWNGGQPKYDIRDWSPEHDRMSKGMTLTEEELKGLFKLLLQKYGKGVKYVEEEENNNFGTVEDDEEFATPDEERLFGD